VPDVFISYARADAKLAKFVYDQLRAEGLDVFLAHVSVEPGQRWSPGIITALKRSAWVIFLASNAACESHFVNHEFGVALGSRKPIVPVVWDQSPKRLPGWMAQFQALDLRHDFASRVGPELSAIAKRIRAKKSDGVLAVIAIVAGLLWASSGAKR